MWFFNIFQQIHPFIQYKSIICQQCSFNHKYESIMCKPLKICDSMSYCYKKNKYCSCILIYIHIPIPLFYGQKKYVVSLQKIRRIHQSDYSWTLSKSSIKQVKVWQFWFTNFGSCNIYQVLFLNMFILLNSFIFYVHISQRHE